MSAPGWLSLPEIMSLVAEKSVWIAERLDRLDAAWHLARRTETTAPPKTFALPALAETWQVEYQLTAARSVSARTAHPGKLLVYGAVGDDALARAALRHWLARRAQEALSPLLEGLAAETGLHFSRLSVRNQRTRWGSCSAAGAISLNCKLLFLPADLLRYVLVHELCHLREHNHTTRYWALLRQHEPEAAVLHRRIREAWQHIPSWAHPARNRVHREQALFFPSP